MEDTRWDRALKVTGGGTGLVGHAGAVLLRKAADQAGLTAVLSAALRKTGTSPCWTGRSEPVRTRAPCAAVDPGKRRTWSAGRPAWM